MPELLLELLSEEIPARMQARAAEDLKRLVTERLKQAGLEFTSAQAYATPRRLALVIEGLLEKQPDTTVEKKGPKVGAPEQALQGFMRANGLNAIEDAEIRETEKGRFYFLVELSAGLPTHRALAEILPDAIDSLRWQKSMRWANTTFRWVRPLHNVLAILDGETIQLDVQLIATVEALKHPTKETRLLANDKTLGHRFLAPNEIEVKSFADYQKKLRKAKVVLDAGKRRQMIAEQADKLTAAEGLAVKDDPALLDEVAGLVEWPVVLTGRIDEAFMGLPPEVLTTAMRSHQKYFATLDDEGRLADRFLLVANMPAPKNSKTAKNIVAGNERVLRARLADARFFWDQDRKRPLAERVPALEQIVFHAKLGTLAEKASRLQTLAVQIARHVPGADRDRARSAARLAKADLVTGMVGEFPELQGLMGRYYALADGEHAEVAEAIAEHYAPQGPGERCPSAPISICVALADKIDTLVGMFAIGETPTGSKDPYALRRAALGVIRLIVENQLRLPLVALLDQAWQLYSSQFVQGRSLYDTRDDLMAFFADRLKVALKDQGVRHDLISAVFALGGEDDLVRLLDRVKALADFLGSEDGANLLVAYRRAANIVRIEAKKDKTSYNGAARTEHFVQDEERALYEALGGAEAGVTPALKSEDFTAAMAAMARLRRPVDAFFDEVTVNADDKALRYNRLNLLARIGATLSQVADFSKIEG